MSTEIEKGVIDFDESIAMWLEQYRAALAKIKEWEEVADVARCQGRQQVDQTA